jgi:hypothetical protein
MTAAMERPLDLEANLQRFQRNLTTVQRFVASHLEEAAYDEKGYIVPNQLHDFYRVPGSDQKALTKKGSEKLAQLFRYFRGDATVVDKTETVEYVAATVTVTLLDHYGRRVGAGTAACSTAEKGFQSPRARRKYGAASKREGNEEKETHPPDFRAALNDVVSRAGKRAFVQAIIYATATDEIFTVSAEDSEDEPPAAPRRIPRLPMDTKTKKKGTPLADLTTPELVTLKGWCTDKKKYPATVEEIDSVLEERRATEDEVAPV